MSIYTVLSVHLLVIYYMLRSMERLICILSSLFFPKTVIIAIIIIKECENKNNKKLLERWRKLPLCINLEDGNPTIEF